VGGRLRKAENEIVLLVARPWRQEFDPELIDSSAGKELACPTRWAGSWRWPSDAYRRSAGCDEKSRPSWYRRRGKRIYTTARLASALAAAATIVRRCI